MYNEKVLSKSCLYVGNLNQKCINSDLFELFNKFGEINDIEVQRTPNSSTRKMTFAFVRFVSPEAAGEAKNEMNGHVFMDAKLL